PQTSRYLVRLANALYYSLVTFTTLGYGDMHPTGWLKALSAIEALTGAVFMALIVAVIARKWMR
ncbi:potassium channel family protein, partial [Thermococcus sp.]